MQGGLNGKKLAEGQLRFGNELEQYLRILDQTQNSLRNAPKDYLLGMAPHSLRAVSPEFLKEIVEARSSDTVHIHIAEQLKEVRKFKHISTHVRWNGYSTILRLIHAGV